MYLGYTVFHTFHEGAIKVRQHKPVSRLETISPISTCRN